MKIEFKICSICKTSKKINDFYQKTYIKKDRQKALHSACKKCSLQQSKKWRMEYYKNNKNKKQEWIERNKEAIKEKARQYYQKNKDIIKQKSLLNKEKTRETKRKYREKNREKIKENQKKYQKEKRRKIQDKANETRKIKIKNSVEYLISCRLRSRMNHAIKKVMQKKLSSTSDLLGCSISDLKKHIEHKFLPGMSWENYGFRGWHIDHIKPCASFDLTDPTEQKKCFHYSNLQPLWSFDNWSKGARTKK
jgi:DNA-directed RNA polymerase beta subunit